MINNHEHYVNTYNYLVCFNVCFLLQKNQFVVCACFRQNQTAITAVCYCQRTESLLHDRHLLKSIIAMML